MRHIPILAYHSVSAQPRDWIAEFAVSPAQFEAHMDVIAEAGATTLCVSELVDVLRGSSAELPERPVVVTFDDGFLDFYTRALPVLVERGIRPTVYVVTGYIDAASGPDGDRMLDWRTVTELDPEAVELGGHGRTHRPLDTLSASDARDEIEGCKAQLEQRLGHRVRSFGYPYGYSSPRVRRLVREAGFDSACGVGNAFSHPGDDVFGLARILVRAVTREDDVAGWIEGSGAPLAPRHERARTRAWRVYRRVGKETGLWDRTEL